MNQLFQEVTWKNFAAAIDMLRNIIIICPDGIWQKEKKIFYMVYHTIIFLDYYLSKPVKDFHAGLPYTIADPERLPAEAIDDVIPNQFYTKEQLLGYVAGIRAKCKKLILETPSEKFSDRWIDDDEINLHNLCPQTVVNYSRWEIIFYNLRHVQHHVGQLNLLLRQKGDVAVGWIAQAN